MGIRKNMLIDKKFQLRTMFSVTVIAVVFFSLCIAALAFVSITTRNKVSSEIVTLNRAVETEDNIVRAFTAFARSAAGSPVKLSVENVNRDHEASMNSIRGHVAVLETLTGWYWYMLVAAIGLAVLAVAAYYFFMIRLTHRMAGPIYVMTRHVQDLIDGREPQFRALRDKDEFKELYAKLGELCAVIKKKA